MVGSVEKRLLEKVEAEGSIHITLIDPEKVTPPQASQIASKARTSGTTAIMIGGSTFVSSKHLDDVARIIKRTVKIPVILFPNNVTGISRYADAIWFMSLLNSADPYLIMGAQVLGAPLIKRYMVHPKLEGVEFLQEILYQFGVNSGSETKVKCLHSIHEKMLENLKTQKETLLMIDEAHMLAPPALEEIRLLLNFQLNDRFLITIILLGQPELIEKVKAIQQLDQRIPIKYHLAPFDLNESIQYILFRQRKAGKQDNAFTEEAMNKIYDYTKGVPRKINSISDLSLLIGFCENQKDIKPEIIEKIINDGTLL